MQQTYLKPAFFYFDLGNVLYFFDYARSASSVAESVGIDIGVIREVIYERGLEELYETGVIDSSRFVSEIARAVGHAFEAAPFLNAVSQMFTFNASMTALIKKLKSLNIRIGLLSNTCPAHWDWITSQKDIDFDSDFEHVVLSYQVGCMKPFDAIYTHAQQLTNVQPEQIFFVDDKLINTDAAKAHGWKAYLYKDATALNEVIATWK